MSQHLRAVVAVVAAIAAVAAAAVAVVVVLLLKSSDGVQFGLSVKILRTYDLLIKARPANPSEKKHPQLGELFGAITFQLLF